MTDTGYSTDPQSSAYDLPNGLWVGLAIIGVVAFALSRRLAGWTISPFALESPERDSSMILFGYYVAHAGAPDPITEVDGVALQQTLADHERWMKNGDGDI